MQYSRHFLLLSFLAMARRKVKLSFITNDGARKSTFKKRKKGIIKKVSEITTLCDIKAAAIIYSPYDSQPEVWPNHTAAHSLLTRFQNMPEMEKSRKMVDQETYLKQRIDKVREQIKKLQKENREKEVTRVMYDCLKGRTLKDLQLRDINDLGWVIDRHLREIEIRKRAIKEEEEDRKQDLLNQVKAAKMETAAAERGAGVMRMSAYEKGGSSSQVQVQVQQQQPQQLAAMEAQTLEQLQMMQIVANRQQAHQNPWFVDIMNPPPPPAGLPDQTMGFMHPPPPPPAPFGDYNSLNAMWSNNFRFP